MNRSVVIKATSKYLHKHSISKTKQRAICCSSKEDIKSETKILKYLTRRQNESDSFTKYLLLFERYSLIFIRSLIHFTKAQTNSHWHYFLVQEDGGQSLFNFVLRIHRYLKNGTLDILEWHKAAQLIWNKMIDAVLYIHAQNVCHFDISLENFLIDGIQIMHTRNCVDGSIQTKIALSNLQIKLCGIYILCLSNEIE